MKTISKLAFAVSTLAFGAAAVAADGNSSVSMFGNVSSQSSGSSDFSGATIYGSYGRLLGDAIELEIQVGQSISGSGGNSSEVSSTSVGATAKLYFAPVGESGSFSPYLKAGLRVNFDKFGGDTRTGYGVLGGAGFEFALGGGVATFVEGTYSRLKYRSDFDNKLGLFETIIGLKLRF